MSKWVWTKQRDEIINLDHVSYIYIVKSDLRTFVEANIGGRVKILESFSYTELGERSAREYLEKIVIGGVE